MFWFTNIRKKFKKTYHARQLLLPSVSVFMWSPASHLRQIVWPFSFVVESEGHFSHVASRPSSALKWSSSQSLHAMLDSDAPSLFDHLPGAHEVHTSSVSAPNVVEYVPLVHGEQTVSAVAVFFRGLVWSGVLYLCCNSQSGPLVKVVVVCACVWC